MLGLAGRESPFAGRHYKAAAEKGANRLARLVDEGDRHQDIQYADRGVPARYGKGSAMPDPEALLNDYLDKLPPDCACHLERAGKPKSIDEARSRAEQFFEIEKTYKPGF